MFEIGSSQLIAEKATKPTTKQFATQMIAGHTSSELKSMAIGKEISSALDSSHQSKFENLKGLNGDESTKEYNSMQVSAHKDAVSLFKRYTDGSEDARLKDWAGRTPLALQPSSRYGNKQR